MPPRSAFHISPPCSSQRRWEGALSLTLISQGPIKSLMTLFGDTPVATWQVRGGAKSVTQVHLNSGYLLVLKLCSSGTLPASN